MNNGKIEQVGTPADIYDRPATPFVMNFIGAVNVVPPHVSLVAEHTAEVLPHPVFIRPHDIEISAFANPQNTPAYVQRVTHLGWEIQVDLILADHYQLVVHLSREQFTKLRLKKGQQVFIQPKRGYRGDTCEVFLEKASAYSA